MNNLINDIKKYGSMIVAITAALIIEFFIFHRICPVAIISGFPCPGCGVTRALAALLTLDFSAALTLNPCIFLWVPLAIYLFICRYILQIKIQRLNLILTIVGVLSILVYIIRMLTMFPDVYPMNYNHDCIMQKSWMFFSDLLHKV